MPGRLVEGTSSPAETPRPVTAYNKSPDARPGWRRLAGAAGRVKQSPSNIVNAAGVCFASRYHFAWGGSDELENETGFRRARGHRGARHNTERGAGAGALLCRFGFGYPFYRLYPVFYRPYLPPPPPPIYIAPRPAYYVPPPAVYRETYYSYRRPVHRHRRTVSHRTCTCK